mmetsp:Transcript_8158/g.11769  ORF Transcript_8158/g.11769 Transcript_8158/m.11769 type:complete len:82 (-) Transcript_8158:42-287(-)
MMHHRILDTRVLVSVVNNKTPSSSSIDTTNSRSNQLPSSSSSSSSRSRHNIHCYDNASTQFWHPQRLAILTLCTEQQQELL